jgi:hypothetical protein
MGKKPDRVGTLDAFFHEYWLAPRAHHDEFPAVALVAQFITLCSASNLAEARYLSPQWQGASRVKTCPSARPSYAHGHHLRPSTNCEKLNDADNTSATLPQ